MHTFFINFKWLLEPQGSVRARRFRRIFGSIVRHAGQDDDVVESIRGARRFLDDVIGHTSVRERGGCDALRLAQAGLKDRRDSGAEPQGSALVSLRLGFPDDAFDRRNQESVFDSFMV